MRGSIRVLHVEDDPDFAAVTATALEREDDRFTVETVPDGAAGLEALENARYDCVVSDHDMPDATGIEFLESVREAHPDLPFILFTNTGSEAVAAEAISAGATDYLRKNGTGEQYTLLANRIANAVEQYRSRRNYRAIFEQVPDGIVIQDPADGSFVDMNARYAELFGYDRSELMAAGFGAIHPGEPPYTVENARERIREAVEAGPRTFEWPGVTRDGDRFWAEVHLAPVRLHGCERVLAVVRDVTERREREAELREKSNLLDQLFEQVPTHLYVKDREGRHLRVSDHLDGVDPEALIGKTDREVYPEELSGETAADDRRVIEEGEPILNKEERSAHDDAWNLTSKVPWYGEDGEIKGLIGVTRRITKRKEYEQKLRRQNERLEEFVGLVSHDLRNPLDVAAGRLELARAECDSEHLDAVADAHDRMGDLIDDLLALARGGDAVEETEPVDLGGAVADSWRNVETGAATVDVATDATIRADRGRLQRLLENLLGNAVEHAGPDVTVTVGDTADGFYVADDGPGIPPEERERIFETGYAGGDGGLGFGLGIVEEIVEAHGWEISVTGSADGGTRFEVTGVTRA